MKNILVIGLGRFGRHMARKFIEEHNIVLAVEKNEERADNAVDILSDIQIGDATNESFIRSLGVNNFDYRTSQRLRCKIRTCPRKQRRTQKASLKKRRRPRCLRGT